MKDINMEKLIKEIMKELGEKKKIFVSEKDFQLELAWAIKEKLKENVKIRLEYSPKDIKIEYYEYKRLNKKISNMYIDILVIYKDKWYPIELKYKTKGIIDNENHKNAYIDENDNEEEIILADQIARDQGRCKYLFDVKRLETLKKEKNKKFCEGFAILLTNDLLYFDDENKDNKSTKDKDFRLWNNRVFGKEILKWDETTGKGTVKGCPWELEMEELYKMEEYEYTDLNVQDDSINSNRYENSKFKYFMIKLM